MVVRGKELLELPVTEKVDSVLIGNIKGFLVDLDYHALVGLLLEDRWSPTSLVVPTDRVISVTDSQIAVQPDALILSPKIRAWIQKLTSQPNPIGQMLLYAPGGMLFGRLIDIYVETDDLSISGYAAGNEKNHMQPFFIHPERFAQLRPPTERMKKDSGEALKKLLRW